MISNVSIKIGSLSVVFYHGFHQTGVLHFILKVIQLKCTVSPCPLHIIIEQIHAEKGPEPIIATYPFEEVQVGRPTGVFSEKHG